MRHGDDAAAWFHNVADIYTRNLAEPDLKKSMKPFRGVFEAVSDVIRAQLSLDGADVAPLMDDDDIWQALKRPDPNAGDEIMKHIVSAWKALNLAHDGKTANKEGKYGFVGLKSPELKDIIQKLHDFGFNNLDPARTQTFKSETGNKKARKRRSIVAPTTHTPNGDNGDDENGDDNNNGDDTTPTTPSEEAAAQALGNMQ